MSLGLTLLVFGNVYFVQNSSLTVNNGSPQIPTIDPTVLQNINQTTVQPFRVPTIRSDCTYAPDSGARENCKPEGDDLAVIDSVAETTTVVEPVTGSEDYFNSRFPNAETSAPKTIWDDFFKLPTTAATFEVTTDEPSEESLDDFTSFNPFPYHYDDKDSVYL